MAVNSMDQVLEYVSNEKLRKTIEDYEKKHRDMEYEAFKQLNILDESGKDRWDINLANDNQDTDLSQYKEVLHTELCSGKAAK